MSEIVPFGERPEGSLKAAVRATPQDGDPLADDVAPLLRTPLQVWPMDGEDDRTISTPIGSI